MARVPSGFSGRGIRREAHWLRERIQGRFELEAGDGKLEIWFELEDIGRVAFSSNLTIGDVEVDYLG